MRPDRELLGEYYERLLSAKELYERDGLEVPYGWKWPSHAARDPHLPPYHSVEGSG